MPRFRAQMVNVGVKLHTFCILFEVCKKDLSYAVCNLLNLYLAVKIWFC